MPIESLLAALRDPRRSTGELLVGVKSVGTGRGVSTRGAPLSLGARDSAVSIIRAALPDDAVIRIGRTFLVVRLRASQELLQRLRALAVVDYLEPNWSHGVM